MKAVVVGILAIFLLIGPFQQPISDGIKGWRTIDTTQTFFITTGAGVTAANVTLSNDLFQSLLSNTITLTSSNLTADPVALTAYSYSSSTKQLWITPLGASSTRTLTVRYYGETDDTVMRALGPFLSILIFGGVIGAILYSMWLGLGMNKRR